MIGLIINKDTDKVLLYMFIKHYNTLNIPLYIHVSDETNFEIDSRYITTNKDIIDSCLLLTENDFLFAYTIDENNDTMVLSYNIKISDFDNPSIIGRVFSVPVDNVEKYTTFEIPDFILYKHANHTNYTIDGIVNKNGNNLSDGIVCFNMKTSKFAMKTEYYQNDILIGGQICKNIYVRYAGNVYINKKSMYGIIWHPKCGCTTICNYFCELNNIDEDNSHLVNASNSKFRYNNYLQNIDVISFVRHPYYRFLSTYFNKHTDKKCPDYLKLDKYITYLRKYKNCDTIQNMINYLIDYECKQKDNDDDHAIDQHSSPISNCYYNKYETLKYSTYHIEDGLNEKLDEFLSRFHNIENNNTCVDNSTEKDYDAYKVNPSYKRYNQKDWQEYIKQNKIYPNYLAILDYELKNKLKKFYIEDLTKQNYSDKPEMYDISIKFINNSLPKDFSVTLYKNINNDLTNMSDIRAKLHYIKSGKNEGRLYNWSSLPYDFNASIYKEINKDLSDMSDTRAKNHYIVFGRKEGRAYNFNGLPLGFNVSMYKEYNADLNIFNDNYAKIHYIKHGKKEGRKHHDKYFDEEFFRKTNKLESHIDAYKLYCTDIRKKKNKTFDKYIDKLSVVENIKYILFVNHDEELYGATKYLLMLYKHVSSDHTYKNIRFILCLNKYNSIINDKYDICRDEIIEYLDDPTLLYMFYKKFNPVKMYFNSCNYAIDKIYNYIPEDIRILHSHEIFEHYTLSDKLTPTYVVSDRIANQYINVYKKKPKVLLPFLESLDFILQNADLPIDKMQIKNKSGVIDTTKIIIGMCGQITSRKNNELFIEMSEVFPDYNFLWIGGNDGSVFDNYDNIYYIPFENNPYKYFKQLIDYFILFSLHDPCPYVVLENILLSSNIITFSDNIYTDHKNELTKDFYFEYDGSINNETCVDAINKFVKNKKTIKYTGGKKYIENNFTFNKKIFCDVLSLDNIQDSNNNLSVNEKSMIHADVISYLDKKTRHKRRCNNKTKKININLTNK